MFDEELREFKYSDEDLIAFAIYIQVRYETDKAQFRLALPGIFSEDFGESLKGLIEDYRTIHSDVEMQHDRSQATELFDTKAIEYLRTASLIEAYAAEAFPKAKNIVKQFKMMKPDRVASDRKGMLVESFTHSRLIKEHAVALKAAGCPETHIKKIADIGAEIQELQFVRTQKSTERTNVKKTRIAHLNEIWRSVYLVHSKANAVFFGKPEQIALYDLPKQKTRKKDETPKTSETPTAM